MESANAREDTVKSTIIVYLLIANMAMCGVIILTHVYPNVPIISTGMDSHACAMLDMWKIIINAWRIVQLMKFIQMVNASVSLTSIKSIINVLVWLVNLDLSGQQQQNDVSLCARTINIIMEDNASVRMAMNYISVIVLRNVKSMKLDSMVGVSVLVDIKEVIQGNVWK